MSPLLSSNTLSSSIQETEQLAISFSRYFKAGDILLLDGDLGSGKTTFSKYFISALTGTNINEITSPTFKTMNLYNSSIINCAHFDLYRMENTQQFLSMGLDEYLFSSFISIIEWPDIILPLLKQSYFHLSIRHAGPNVREFSLAENYP